MKRLEAINAEAEKATPDLKRVDDELAQFLVERLQHFCDTLEERIQKRAKALVDYYSERLGEHARNSGLPVEELKEAHQSYKKTEQEWAADIRGMLAPVEQSLEAAKLVMQNKDGYKARSLAKIMEEVSSRGWGSSLGNDGNPTHPDTYKKKV